MKDKEYPSTQAQELVRMIIEGENPQKTIDALDAFVNKKWDEACELQKKICSEQVIPLEGSGNLRSQLVFTQQEKELILNSPKPKYK